MAATKRQIGLDRLERLVESRLSSIFQLELDERYVNGGEAGLESPSG